MTNRKIAFIPVFCHLVPSDLENWLEQMAAKGWHLQKIGQWSSLLMIFRRSEPVKYRFVYDPQISPRREYIQTYEQFGWEYLGHMASTHIWRMKYQDKRPEAFSDPDSLVKRNRYNLATASVAFTIFLVATLATGISLGIFSDSLSTGDKLQVIIADIFFALITTAMGMVMIILRKNERR